MDDLRNLPSTEPDEEEFAQSDDAFAPDEGIAPKKRHSRAWYLSRLLAVLLLGFLVLLGWLAVTAPLSKSLQPLSPPQITLLAADGTPIARNGALVEAPVEVARLPAHVSQAFLAIEDRRFHDHWGIDPRGMARALWTNMTTGRTEGGSTITQQLAKFTFLSADRTLGRKAREALIAFWLEAWLSKDEILQRYLSNAYFGDNTYGLRAASLHYFHRQPEKLTLGQSAMLAGLMKAPSSLAPSRHYDRAEKRMRVVLHAMVEAGYLKPDEVAAVRAPRLDVRTKTDLPTGTYFADWALPQARGLNTESYSRQTYTTTLDARLQAAARRAIAGAPLGSAQVALVAMHPNGEVVAMVGGRDYAKTPFNRATQAHRQPGSTFKLFVYLAALKNGWKPTDSIENTPIETGGYRPENAGNRYSATITLEDGFAHSSNVAAVRLLGKVGDKAVIGMARSLGLTSPLPEGDPSIALGTATTTLLELTSAYAGVAGNRFPVEPTAFPAGKEGWFDGILGRKRSLSEKNHAAIEKMLRAAINRGTGRTAMLRAPNFGKTGTSQENRDALFVGYARDLVVGVWVGNDDNSPLNGVSGGSIPARIWRDFMREALGEHSAPAAHPDPGGPVQPLDLPDLGTIPLGEVGNLRFENGQAIISGQINGNPIDLRIDNDGLQVDGSRIVDEISQGVRQGLDEKKVGQGQQAPPGQ
ncbi:transglycosylase domain-containing protein [Novosphingobium mangrovi (ex Huang et al. 2023)]|uniref:peptidoglycan glycosyltransferase n=1 Tax=Novosphingobium mangrovi (ex Huang et al. 2023) TaxID=2976432 RepID=A0ABT2I3Y4_9SPHN|nr:transglycosylase domain-containing protein [Novosphingobium mangrovi (ex Huang et al. 2023)]MCT2399515.1 transglycosylase domain-containing protein [Novosphingobium mangrovi (ex Huang et al. 2023)]